MNLTVIDRMQLLQLFAWMQRTRKISFASYSSYIKHMGKSLSPVKALEIYDSIKDESTRNHVSVCNSVLSCLVRSGKYDSSFKLFHQMKRNGLKPDIVTYSTVCILFVCAMYISLDVMHKLKSYNLFSFTMSL